MFFYEELLPGAGAQGWDNPDNREFLRAFWEEQHVLRDQEPRVSPSLWWLRWRV